MAAGGVGALCSCILGRMSYNSLTCPSGGMADAEVSKTFVFGRVSSNLTSGTIRNRCAGLTAGAFSFEAG